MLLGLRVPIWKVNFCSMFLRHSVYQDGEKGHKPPCAFKNDCGGGGGVSAETIIQSAAHLSITFLHKVQVIR